ncbi:MAG: hypothetical protein DI582_07015 [Azospirillum brasilense]|nr:MAG: hypothetical protein DI582_07015 [Azospirillum brasilense]
MPARALTDRQAQACTIVNQWYTQQKCHRIDQLFMDHPEFAGAVSAVYDQAMKHDGDIPSKCVIATQLILQDEPGFVDAVHAMQAAKAPLDMIRAQRSGTTTPTAHLGR